MAFACRKRARPLVPRAALLVRPLEHVEVATACRKRARPPVPRAAALARPLEHLEAGAARRVGARPPVPRAAARARPLQQPQVATPSRGRAELVFLRLLQLLARLSRLERDGGRRRAARPTQAEQVRHLLHSGVDDRADVGVEEDRGRPVEPTRVGAGSSDVAASAQRHRVTTRGRAPTRRRRVGARMRTVSA